MFKGYCFMVDGTHTPAIELKGIEEVAVLKEREINVQSNS